MDARSRQYFSRTQESLKVKFIAVQSINGGILLANPEIGFYCSIYEFLLFYNIINYNIQIAESYVHSDVRHEVCFFARFIQKLFL